MICSSCGKEIPDGKKFCKYCGASTARKCEKCGAPLDSDALFCEECGARIDTEYEEKEMTEADVSSSDTPCDDQWDHDTESVGDSFSYEEPHRRRFDEEDDFYEDNSEVSADKRLAFENANPDCVIIPRRIAESKNASEICSWFQGHADKHFFAVEYGTRIIRCLIAQPGKELIECENTNIEKVVIPDTVKIIGKMAFFGCFSLKKIVIPSSVTTIGSHAFYCCKSLAEIHIPDSVKRIGECAFYYCSPNTRLYVSDMSDLYWIGDLYFNYKEKNSDESYEFDFLKKSVEKIFINDEEFSFVTASNTESQEEMDEWVKSNTNGQVILLHKWYIPRSHLYKKVIIPEFESSIHEYDFFQCELLTEIYLPSSVTWIQNYAFKYCKALRRINIPDSVTFIGNDAFSECSSLTEITIPESVTSIGDNAFSGCSSLTEITIPDSVTSIGIYAFSNCDSLTEVSLPDSVTAINDNVFSDCKSLTKINIPDSLTAIGYSAFSWCSSLTEITIPDSVTSIGMYAFSNCDSLTEVSLPGSVTAINDNVFSNCKSLTKINIPDSVTSIGKNAFSWCISLKELTIPNSVTSVGEDICCGNTSLEKLSIPCTAAFSNVTLGISRDPYSETQILKELVFTGNKIDGDIKKILDMLPYAESIILPDGLQKIPERLFASYIITERIYDPSSPTMYSAINHREVVKKVTIPYSVVHIGRRAFSGLSNLAVDIPESVVSIGEEAFRDCGGSVIRIPKYVNNIGADAFAGCKVDISDCDPNIFQHNWLSGAEVCSPVSYLVVKELYSDSKCNTRFSNVSFPKTPNTENAATNNDEIITSAGVFFISGKEIQHISANGEKISVNIFDYKTEGNIDTSIDGYCGSGREIKSLSFTAADNYVFVNRQSCTYSCYTYDANVIGGFIAENKYGTPYMYCEVYDFSSSDPKKVVQNFGGKLVKSVRTQNNGEIAVQFDNGESTLL